MVIQQQYLTSTRITIQGDYYKYITGNGLYLSSSNVNFNLSSFNFYSNIRLVSSANPPFNGTPVEDFTIASSNELVFDLPANLPKGKYDIIFCNPAGYVNAMRNKQFKGINIV